MFELDTVSGELLEEGKAPQRLRDQALLMLTVLLEQADELVTREELRKRLWPADTFVDFDHGLNTSMNQIRNALGDSAQSPRFIQTLPRRGYRFIAPVEKVAVGGRLSGREELAEDREVEDERLTTRKVGPAILSEAGELPVMRGGVVRILFVLIQVMYLTFYIVALARLSKVEEALAAAENFEMMLFVGLIVTAAIGIPIRLYLLSGAALRYEGLNSKFQKIFPVVLILDGLWALAPFLLVAQIGVGLAIASAAILLYLPFSQRSLLLMGGKSK